MSAWRVGTDAVGRTSHVTIDEKGGAAQGAHTGFEDRSSAKGDGKVQTTIDQVTKWIPGDALALYAAGVTAFAAKQGARPSVVLLIIGIAAAAAIVLASAFASSGSLQRTTLLPAALAAGAFTIWSVSVPFSGWQRWDLVHDNQAPVALFAAVAALFFGLIAEGLTKRFGIG